MSEGSTASAPYTRKNGVNPVDLFGVVRKLHKTEGTSSAQAPAARRSGASSEVHLLQGLQVHDVQTGSAIHEALGEIIPVYAWTNYTSVALLMNYRRVVAPVEDAGILRPLDVLRNRW